MAESVTNKTKLLKPAKSSTKLIRNPIKPVCSSKSVEKHQKLKKVHFVENETEEEEEEEGDTFKSQDLTSPEFCSLLKIVEEIKKIQNMDGSSQSLPEGPRYRNLNFPPQEKIFQNLIGIEMPVINKVRSQTCFKLNAKKDPEPDYSKYLKYDLEPEYFFSSNAAPVVKEPRIVFNGRSDYNKLKLWKEQN